MAEKLIGAQAIADHEGIGLASLMDRIQLEDYPATKNKDGVWEVTTSAADVWHKSKQAKPKKDWHREPKQKVEKKETTKKEG